MGNEFGDIGVGWIENDFFGFTELDDPPCFHDRDMPPELERFVEIVAHEQDRFAESALQIQQPRPAGAPG